MRSNRLITASLAAVALALGTLHAAQTTAGDDALRKQVLAFNDLTGTSSVRERLQDLLDQPDKAKQILAEAKAIAKAGKPAFKYNAALLLASLAEELKDPATAEQFYRACIKQAFDLRSTAKLAQAYGNLIEMYYNEKKYDQSAKVCQELLELKVVEKKPRLILIPDERTDDDFFEMPRYDLTRFIRQGVMRMLIKAIAKQGKYDQALKTVENLIREEKDDWMDVQLKGWVQREAGKEADAAKTYERAIGLINKDKTLEPDEKEFYVLQNRYLLSGLYVDINQVDKAAQQLKILIEKKPKEAAYYNDLGFIWADHDMNLAESEKLIRKALELDRERRKESPNFKAEDDRDSGSYLDSMGWVLYKQKKYKEAKEYLKKALEDKSAQHIEIYDHLGDTCLKLGQRTEAVEAWRRGLEFVGDSRRDRERRAEVEKKIKKYEKE